MAAEWVQYDSWLHKHALAAPLPLGSYLIQHDAARTRCWVSTEQADPIGAPHRMRTSARRLAPYRAPYEVEVRDDPVPLSEDDLRAQHFVSGG
jgi:hypothetical protein